MTRPSRLRLLLISNSTQHGRGYLDHVEAEIKDFLGTAQQIVFVPFALQDRRAYARNILNSRHKAMWVLGYCNAYSGYLPHKTRFLRRRLRGF